MELMRKMVLLAAVAACTWFAAPAQISFSLNIGAQPAWGPVGYDYADYYYLPEADCYYDIGANLFVYREGPYWRRAAMLPSRFGYVDLYRTHKVVINHVRDPWMNHNYYYGHYRGYAHSYNQYAIRDAQDRRYWGNPGNRYHGQWNGGGHGDDHGRGNWNGGGHGDDHGRGGWNGGGHGDDHGHGGWNGGGHGNDHGHGGNDHGGGRGDGGGQGNTNGGGWGHRR
jgi:hypothetical protein